MSVYFVFLEAVVQEKWGKTGETKKEQKKGRESVIKERGKRRKGQEEERRQERGERVTRGEAETGYRD